MGNPRARAELRAWAESWASDRPPAQRAAVLAGPAGTGKTSAALALAEEFGWTLVEMNASDARNETAVEQIAGRASITHTLADAGRGKRPPHALILLDEADSLTGRLTETPRPKPESFSLRDFLRGRYSTVESLNNAYGLKPGSKPTPFEDWDAVPRSPGTGAWARLAPARRDIEEWRNAGRAPDLSDRGGMGAISRLVRATRQPLVLTVNDESVLTRYSPVFRTGVRRVRFYPIRDAELRARLVEVVRDEGLRVVPGAFDAITRRARGDLRAALNDLDAIAALPPEEVQLAVLGARDPSADLAELAGEVLSVPRFYRSVEVQERIDAPPDDLLPWIEENLPHFAPDAMRREQGFGALAVAARFLDRARRARVWSLWSYASEVMTGGVSLALRDRPGPAAHDIAFPRFLGEMGRSRGQRALRDGIAAKAGVRFHLSRRKARESVIPFLESLLIASRRREPAELRRTAGSIVRELALTAEEVGYLLGVEPGNREVASLLAPEESSDDTGRTSAPEPPRAEGRGPGQRHLSDFGG